MRRSYSVNNKKQAPENPTGFYKTSETNDTLYNLNQALENNNVEEFFKPLGTPQEPSTNLNSVKKPNEFSQKPTKLLCLNTERRINALKKLFFLNKEAYKGASKNCGDEFIYFDYRKPILSETRVSNNSAATALCASAIGKGNIHITFKIPKLICKLSKVASTIASLCKK